MTGLVSEHAFLRTLTAATFLSSEFFDAGAFGGGALFAHRFDLVEEEFASEETVEALLAGFLTFDLEATGAVEEHYAGRGFVDVLTAMATGADERFFDVGFADAQRSHALGELRFFVR
jgi:hypothetical protein